MKADSQIPVECRHRLLSIVTMCLCMLSVYAGRPAQLHCLGNGNYCVFGQGADIESIFAGIQFTLIHPADRAGYGLHQQFTDTGNCYLEHTLYKEEIVARFKDFIDSKSAIYTRMVECLKPLPSISI